MLRCRSPLSLFVAAGSVVCAASGALAQQTFFTWNGPNGGGWGTAANWTPFGIPAVAGHVALIPANTNPVLNLAVTIDKFGMGANSQLTINNGIALTVIGQTDNLGVTGLMSNEGTILLNSAGAGTDLIIAGGAGHFAVHGHISGTTARIVSSNTQANRIYGSVGNELLIFGEGTLFEGSAQIGLNRLELTNFGTLRAVGSQGVTVDPSAAGFNNHGTLAAISGGMTITGGTFRNLGAGTMVSSDAAFNVNGARVEGGLFQTTPAGAIFPSGSSTLANTTLSGNMVITNGATALVESTFTLASPGSTLLLNSAGAGTDLILTTDALIDGTTGLSGITSSNTQANRIYSSSSRRFTLTRGFISGSMQLGLNLMSLTVSPSGLVEATQPQGMTIDPNADGVINQGVLVARNGSGLLLTSGAFDNVAGTIRADAGGLVRLSAATFLGGILDGQGVFNLQDSAIIDGVTSNADIIIPNGATGFARTTLTNNDTFLINSAGAATDLRIIGDTTLNGTGLLTTSNTQANRLYSDGFRLTHASGHTIRGSMQLGLNLMSVTNNGLIEAEGSQGMTIDPNADGVDNNATLRARTGSTLVLSAGAFDNAQGVINAQDAAVVRLSAAAVTGGLLSTSGSGVVQFQDSSLLTGVTSAADIVISNGQTGFVAATFVNGDTLLINSSGALTDLRLNADTVISGPGVLTSSDTQANRVYGTPGMRLTNAAGHTIRGAMQLGVNLMGMTNNGLIEAQGSQGMTINPDATGFDNNATLRALSGSSLTLVEGGFDNAGGVIDAAAGGSVIITGCTVIGGNLSSTGSGFIRHEGGADLKDVTSHAAIVVNNGQTSFLRDTFINNSTYTINSAGALTDLRILGNTTLSGPGVINTSNTQANRFYAANTRLTNAQGHTIRGSLQLGVNLMSITNNGLIEAVGNQGITIDPDAAGFDNNGTIRSTFGSPLLLTSGTFDNATGVIDVPGGGLCTVGGGAIILGGTIQSAGGGIVNLVESCTLNGPACLADMRVPNGQTAFLSSSLINLGSLTINSSGAATDLRLATDTVLSGNGTLTSSNTQANRFYGNGGTRLTNGAGHTIRGAMQLGVNLIGITNQGTINADASQGTTIDAAGAGFDNQGALLVTGGNVVIGDGPFTTSGTVIVNTGRRLDRVANDFVQTGGTVLANGEIEVANNVYTLQGGTLGGSGVVDANVVNSGGIMSPGNSAGTLTIDGSYTQQAGGTFDFEVGGIDNPSQNDTLNLTAAGSATLGGTIRISRLNGFVPNINQGFTIVGTAPNQRFGEFANIVSDDFWAIVYLHNAAVAVFNGVGDPPCAPDFNGDGNLDPDDLADYIACYFTQPCPQADYSGDGNIDPDDLADYIAAYFGGC